MIRTIYFSYFGISTDERPEEQAVAVSYNDATERIIIEGWYDNGCNICPDDTEIDLREFLKKLGIENL